MSPFPLIIAGVLLNTIAQIALKLGMRSIGYFDFSLQNIVPIGLKIVRNPQIFLGLSCYVLSVVIWLLALSRVDVSYAYPMTSLGYIFTAILGFLMLGESLSPMRILGIVVILIGVYLVSRS